MGQYDCVITNQYDNGQIVGFCVDCPEVPAIAGTPTQVISDPNLGWNSSAYSAIARDGDCYTRFYLPPATGVVVGFAPQRLSDHPRDVNYGFYVRAENGGERWSVLENGIEKTAPVARAAGDEFRIERRAGVIAYFVNGKQKYTSTVASYGPLVVIACMYSADDGVY